MDARITCMSWSSPRVCGLSITVQITVQSAEGYAEAVRQAAHLERGPLLSFVVNPSRHAIGAGFLHLSGQPPRERIPLLKDLTPNDNSVENLKLRKALSRCTEVEIASESGFMPTKRSNEIPGSITIETDRR